jgi:hypothetical protein
MTRSQRLPDKSQHNEDREDQTRRPKMLLSGTMKMLASPDVMTVAPVSNASWLFLRWNSAPRRGNMGAMDREPVTAIHVKSAWLVMTVTEN